MRVVLDTNVIISALNFPGNERFVLELALRGRFEFYLSLFILEAAAGVLVRKSGWDEERTAQAIRVIENAAIVIEPLVSEPLRLPEVIEGGHADNRVPFPSGPEHPEGCWGLLGGYGGVGVCRGNQTHESSGDFQLFFESWR